MKKCVVTGANGFLGRSLTKYLLANNPQIEIILADISLSGIRGCFSSDSNRVHFVEGDIRDAAIREQIAREGANVLYHLAALPGGSSEAQPELSKSINLDATLSLLEEISNTYQQKEIVRVVYASTIAVLGSDLPAQVDDSIQPAPSMTYGTHKAMVELALADMSRRKIVDGLSLRLPGILARPGAPSGLKSAFLSDVFHTLSAHKPFISPVSESAGLWLNSISTCVENIAAAGHIPARSIPASRTVNLPVTHCSMGELCKEILFQTKASSSLLTYVPNENLEAQFGCYPPHKSYTAEQLGFKNDENLRDLVASVLNELNRDP